MTKFRDIEDIFISMWGYLYISTFFSHGWASLDYYLYFNLYSCVQQETKNKLYNRVYCM
jgi:hypothetical protein